MTGSGSADSNEFRSRPNPDPKHCLIIIYSILFQITKEDGRAASDTIKLIFDHFAALGDAALSTKLKELSGK
jgi:hypothetical protein